MISSKIRLKTWQIIVAGILTAMLLLPRFPIVQEYVIQRQLQDIAVNPEIQDIYSLDKILEAAEIINGDIQLDQQAQAELDWIINTNGFLDYETDMEKVDAVNRWVKANISYTDDKSSSNWEMRKYGNATLLNRSGDCCGHARVTKMIFDELGIECHTIRLQYRPDPSQLDIPEWVLNKIESSQHAVSAVKIDDQWFVLDNTINVKSTEKPMTPEEFSLCTVYYEQFIGPMTEATYVVRYWTTDAVAEMIGLPEFSINRPDPEHVQRLDIRNRMDP